MMGRPFLRCRDRIIPQRVQDVGFPVRRRKKRRHWPAHAGDPETPQYNRKLTSTAIRTGTGLPSRIAGSKR